MLLFFTLKLIFFTFYMLVSWRCTEHLRHWYQVIRYKVNQLNILFKLLLDCFSLQLTFFEGHANIFMNARRKLLLFPVIEWLRISRTLKKDNKKLQWVLPGCLLYFSYFWGRITKCITFSFWVKASTYFNSQETECNTCN